MSNQPIRLLIVDDYGMVRKGLKALLSHYEDILIIGEAANGMSAIEFVKRQKTDVVLMDLLMPVMDGIEATQKILAIQSNLRIIVLTALAGEDQLTTAIRSGAMGILLKDAQPEDLVEAIRTVYKGEPWITAKIAYQILQQINEQPDPKQPGGDLSDREMEVLSRLTKGKTDQQIADELVVSEVTIRSHVKRVITKLGLRNRVDVALYGIRTGLVSLDEVNLTSMYR